MSYLLLFPQETAEERMRMAVMCLALITLSQVGWAFWGLVVACRVG